MVRSTLFQSATDPRTARRKWIGGRLKTRGEIRIDAGARRAIEKGASLLPAGVTDVWGDFVRGDAVLVLDENGLRIGCGLASFGAVEMRSVIGRRSEEIEQIWICVPSGGD
ncbi:MAG: PUA domain-containing protein [Parvularculaceae bacterium]